MQAVNRLAVATDKLAWKAHTALNADVSLENPDPAFLWKFGLFAWQGWDFTNLLICWEVTDEKSLTMHHDPRILREPPYPRIDKNEKQITKQKKTDT